MSFSKPIAQFLASPSGGDETDELRADLNGQSRPRPNRVQSCLDAGAKPLMDDKIDDKADAGVKRGQHVIFCMTV
jgi:hypothetical protein